MIPLVSTINALNSATAFLFAGYLYTRTRTQYSASASYFTFFFLCYGVMWALYSAPGIMTASPYGAAIFHSLGDVMLFITSIVGVRISFFAFEKSLQKNIWTVLFLSAGIVYAILRYKYFAPHLVIQSGQYTYWQPNIPQWLVAIPGSVAAVASFVFMTVFFILGRRAGGDPGVYYRSMHFVVGMGCILAAAVLFFIVSIASPTLAVTSSLLSVIGLLIMLRGVLVYRTS